MQYLLTESEFQNLKSAEKEIAKIRKVIRKNFEREKNQYNFDEESFKMLISVLGGCGSAFTANVDGNEFVVCKNHKESCEIADKLEALI